MASFLSDIRVNKNVDSFVLMKNFSGETEVVYFLLSGGGYVVASYKDGHIIEYSPQEFSGLIEAIDEQTIYYGGPQMFCVQDGRKFRDVIKNVSFTATNQYYSVNYVDSIGEYIQNSNTENCEDNIQQTKDGLLSSPRNYLSASDGWFCTITGISNLLQYYKDYRYADVYMSTASNAATLRSSLYSYSYINNNNNGLWFSAAIGRHCADIGLCMAPCYCGKYCNCSSACACTSFYSGLNSYFNRNDVADYFAIASPTICDDAKYLLNKSYPLLMVINTSSIDASANTLHTVLCYGYWETSMTTYYIVNDGWGHNSVYVCADDMPEDSEMMFLV